MWYLLFFYSALKCLKLGRFESTAHFTVRNLSQISTKISSIHPFSLIIQNVHDSMIFAGSDVTMSSYFSLISPFITHQLPPGQWPHSMGTFCHQCRRLMSDVWKNWWVYRKAVCQSHWFRGVMLRDISRNSIKLNIKHDSAAESTCHMNTPMIW